MNDTALTINLKHDPFERFVEARGFDEWQEDRAFTVAPATNLVSEFVATFQDFPPRQRGFNVDVNELLAKSANTQR